MEQATAQGEERRQFLLTVGTNPMTAKTRLILGIKARGPSVQTRRL